MSKTPHNNLKAELKKAGRTQTWLKDKMGWTKEHMSRLCNMRTDTTRANWEKIAQLLETKVEDLLRKDIS